MLETRSSLTEKNMSHCHRNQADNSTKTGKKGRRLKKNHSVEACRCVTPFVKLHWWDCPEVQKPCPIHGNIMYQNVKPEKVEPDQNVTISFHPSSRTENLFEPVKSLLAQYGPETKINFQYFSPGIFPDKKNLKNENIQTSFDDLRKGFSSNVSVEKTKSSVNDRTNKMKKLKECFRSPCNSIAQNHPSPIPVRRNFNEISLEEAVQPWPNFFNGEINCGQSSEWLPSDSFGFKKLDKLTADKRDSDFITVTQHDRDNVVNHKIFEIDHRKGLNEKSDFGFGKEPTQFAYSSFNVNNPNEPGANYNNNTFIANKDSQTRKGLIKTKINESQISLSSDGSVYVTPFLLIPQEVESSDKDSFEEDFKDGKRSVGVQVNEGCEEKSKVITKYVQISAFESSDSASEQKMNTVSLQTDPRKYIRHCGSSEGTISEKYSYNEKVVQTNIHDNTTINRSTMKVGSKVKTTEVQTSNRYQVKEVLITRYNKPTKEAANQVENSAPDLQEGYSSTLDKSLITQSSFANKKTQISNTPEADKNSYYSKQLEDEVGSDRMPNIRSQKFESDSDFEGKKEEKEQKVILASSSRSPVTSQRQMKSPKEERISPVSDLSELKRIISEFFERATCNCKEKEYERMKENRVNVSTVTDSPRSNEKATVKEKPVSKEMQTTEPFSTDKAVEAKPKQLDETKYRQTVLLDDANCTKPNYVCFFCGRNIDKFCTHASTNTEHGHAVKEKTTVIETDYTEVTKIKKNVHPNDPSRKCITTSKKQTIKPINYYKTEIDCEKKVHAKTSPPKLNSSVSTMPVTTKTPLRDEQERSKQDADSNLRAKPIETRQSFKECHCNKLYEKFISEQDNKDSRSGLNCQDKANKTDNTNSQTKYREESKDKKESQKQSNRQLYSVSVNSSWPRDLVNWCKSQEIDEESSKRYVNQKIGSENDGQPSDTFFSRNFDETEESQLETCESEKQNFSDVEKTRKFEDSSKENSSFVRMPSSSASQIQMNKNLQYQSKVIKSEESVKAVARKLPCNPIEIFKEDVNDLFTVKSCHLKPMAMAYDGRSCDKLIACSFCKSLMLIKVNKNDDVHGSNNQNHIIQSESEEKVQLDEVFDQPSTHNKSSLLHVEEQEEEEYVEECSSFSGITTRTLEHRFLKEENSDSDSRT